MQSPRHLMTLSHRRILVRYHAVECVIPSTEWRYLVILLPGNGGRPVCVVLSVLLRLFGGEQGLQHGLASSIRATPPFYKMDRLHLEEEYSVDD